jgi:hypothetical protein
MRKFLFASITLLVSSIAAHAQFDEQKSYANSSSGSGNNYVISMPNVHQMSDVLGVHVKFLPNFADTGNSTLTINPSGLSCTIKKASPSGPVPLTGGEIIVTGVSQMVDVMWDTAECLLMNPANAVPQYTLNFRNLRVFNAATVFGDSAPGTPNTQISIAAGSIAVEDASGNSVRLTNYSCTINFLVNTFSAGNGGLDTGSPSVGNWYYEWVIYNPTTQTASCLGSLASTRGSIALPSGYNFAARVGANFYLTNGSTGFQRVIQYGPHAHYVVTSSSPTSTLKNLAVGGEGNISTPVWVAKSVASVVPPTASIVDFSLIMTNSTGTSVIMAAPNNSYGGANSFTNPPPCIMGGPTGVPNSSICRFGLEGGGNIYTANNNAPGPLLQVYGWEDNL